MLLIKLWALGGLLFGVLYALAARHMAGKWPEPHSIALAAALGMAAGLTVGVAVLIGGLLV